jgi:hypothetical protein
MRIVFILFSFLAFNAFAENIDIKDVKTDQDTTIQIKKGSGQDLTNQYEIVSGQEEISGDPAPLLQTARENWKKACADWKKETKELNKDNSIISLNCGTMQCSTAAMESSCKSTGLHKIKVQVK